MMYRVRDEDGRFRAEILIDNCWHTIENDNNDDRCWHVVRFDSVEDAVDACKKHHIEMGYDKMGFVDSVDDDVVKVFEL